MDSSYVDVSEEGTNLKAADGSRVAAGEIAYVEDVAEGLENAPKAFMSLLKGGNTGKMVVKIHG